MHVSKTIRDYIDREVESRLMVKYGPLQKEAERQSEALGVFNAGIKAAGLQAAQNYVAEHIQEVSDFAEDNTLNMRSDLPYFVLKRRYVSGGIHQWRDQLRQEKEAKANEISAILELGGDKCDLDRFLSDLEDSCHAQK